MKTLLLVLIALMALLASPVLAAEPTVTLGIDRLEGEADEAYWDRLFTQCASWTAVYGEVSQPAKEKLMALGVPPLYHLVPTWLGDGDVRHRVTLEEIIVKVGPDSAPTLLHYIADPNRDLRQRCIFVLGDFDRPDILPALRSLLATESDLLVLPSLIEAVGKRGIGASNLADGIAPLTAHSDERVRRASAVALGRIGDPAAMRPLGWMLNDSLFSVRQPARDALLKLMPKGRYSSFMTPIAPSENRALATELWNVDVILYRTGEAEFATSFQRSLDEADPLELIGLVRGVLSGWKIDHAKGDLCYALLPEHFEDARVEATRVMIINERDRLLKAEAVAAP